METKKKNIPLFVVQSIEGKKLKFGLGSPKPTLLILLTTTCGCCEKAIPAINKKFSQLQSQFNIIGVGRGHYPKELKKWKEDLNLHFQLVADPERKIFEEFAKIHVPRFYIIATNGKVLYQDVHWHPLMLEDMADIIRQTILSHHN